MPLPFTRDQFLDVFAAYNDLLWPCVLTLWLLTASVVVRLVRTRYASQWSLNVLLVTHWAWAALAYHAAFFARINPAAWLFSGLFLVQAGLLAWHGVLHARLRFSGGRSLRHVAAWVLVVYALVYQAIALVEGHALPRLPTFGVPHMPNTTVCGFHLQARSSGNSPSASCRTGAAELLQ